MEMLTKFPMRPQDDQDDIDVKALDASEGVGLSTREMDILKELVSGKGYKAIGEKLFISSTTVRKHVSNIYDKLHVNSRAQVINIAYKKKWV
jgi:DNA-binding NarL/FixJ family response regulator